MARKAGYSVTALSQAADGKKLPGPLPPAAWHTYLPDVPYRRTC
ncbi:hypothetical protein ACFVYD_19800 [Streptomyces sp. NPDC058301]